MNISRHLKRLRLEKGFSQSSLAELSGIAQPNLAAMEQARRQPTLATLARLAQALDCPVAELLGEGVKPALDRFEMDAVCRNLVAGKEAPEGLDSGLWSDLGATFHQKLKAMDGGFSQARPRISARAAQSRLQARLGPEAFRELAQRLDKAYPR